MAMIYFNTVTIFYVNLSRIPSAQSSLMMTPNLYTLFVAIHTLVHLVGT